MDMADQQLDTRAVAERLKLSVHTIRAYRKRQRRMDAAEGPYFPPPDGLLGGRPWWWASTIDAWQAERPGPGAGGGRPRKAAP